MNSEGDVKVVSDAKDVKLGLVRIHDALGTAADHAALLRLAAVALDYDGDAIGRGADSCLEAIEHTKRLLDELRETGQLADEEDDVDRDDPAEAIGADRDAEAPEPTVAQLCHEWRLVNAKLQYDLACLTDGHNSDDLCTTANARIHEIEEELAAAEIDDLDDAQAVLSIIGKNMDEQLMGAGRDRAMLSAVHRGMNQIRNKLAPAA